MSLSISQTKPPPSPWTWVGALTMTAVKSDQQPYPLGSHLSYKTAPIVFNPPGSEKISVSHENNPSQAGIIFMAHRDFFRPWGIKHYWS